MKIDKAKLFLAIQERRTEFFKMTYDLLSFDYSPKDMEAEGGSFRIFQGREEFFYTAMPSEEDVPKIVEGFKKIKEELERLGCLMPEEAK